MYYFVVLVSLLHYIGSKHILTTGLFISLVLSPPVFIFSVTARTISLAPGCIFNTRPSLQFSGAVLSSFIKTKAPSVIEGWEVTHLGRFCNLLIYSDDQRFQKDWVNCCISCHLDKRLIGNSNKLGFGIAVSGKPIKKWPRVNASVQKFRRVSRLLCEWPWIKNSFNLCSQG